MNDDHPVPLGVPFEIDSPVFSGRALLRFRNAKSDDEASHSKYFDSRKRLMQIVIQGQFKRKIKMSEVYAGSMFVAPLKAAPPPRMTKLMNSIIGRIAPGLVLDLSSNEPKVICLIAGCQSMSIDLPGNEPDITLPDIQENVSVLGKSCSTVSKRRKHLGNPKKAALYDYDTKHVYTFHMYDDVMCYGNGTMKLPVYGDYDIKPSIGNQPLSLTGVTKDGDIVYDLRVWHESHHDDCE